MTVSHTPRPSQTAGRLLVPMLWLADRKPIGHVFLAKAQAKAAAFYTRRGDGWLYAGRARTRHRERGALHDRQPRSHRAAAIARVAAHDVGRMDVRNLQVIDYAKADGFSIRKKARATGLSIDVVKGAQADLKSCGYMGSHQRRQKNPDGTWPIARRWFTAKFFRQLGLWRDLIAMRKLLGLAPPKEPKIIGPAAMLVSQIAAKVSAPWPRK